MSAARKAVVGDIYGPAVRVPVGEFGFVPARNVFTDVDSSPTLHGKTHAEMSRITNPEDPEKWSDSPHSLRAIHVDLEGPRGNIHGYVDADIFDAVCEVLGVAS